MTYATDPPSFAGRPCADSRKGGPMANSSLNQRVGTKNARFLPGHVLTILVQDGQFLLTNRGSAAERGRYASRPQGGGGASCVTHQVTRWVTRHRPTHVGRLCVTLKLISFRDALMDYRGGRLTAPDQCCRNVKKPLARAPSTRDPRREIEETYGCRHRYGAGVLRLNHPHRDLVRSIGVYLASPPTPRSRPEALF
jgi:hypothetical protein